MRRIRIQGVVRLANLVRRQLGSPMSAAALDELRTQVAETVEQLELVLSDEGLRPEAMSPASRKAYEFLKGVDLDSIETSADAEDEGQLLGNVRITGLKGRVDAAAHRIADAPDAAERARIHEEISSGAEQIEELMLVESLQPEHLHDETRIRLAWLKYLADREHFDAYVEAVARARPAFDREAAASSKYAPPVWVCFVPTKGIFRLRGCADGTRATLPTPMIALDAAALAEMAAMAFRRHGRQRVLEHMLGDGYRAVAAELDALAGITERTAGAHHDLAAAFDRVNAAYFDGIVERPRLTWSRSYTMRKFGHYDYARDTVMVSSTLDRADVPAFVVDYIVFHELLHKKLGLTWRAGRKAAHTAEFRRRESRFKQLDEARAVLQKLAARG
jgi:hypothetical protein